MTGDSLREHLHSILEDKLLPAARNSAPLILLEAPVFIAPRDQVSQEQASYAPIQVVSAPGKPLPKVKPQRSHIALYYWPDQFLNALRVPYLACVFEGEADITTALTVEKAKQYSSARDAGGMMPFGRQTVSIREPGFFLVPPGAPVSYGPRPHWERPDPQNAYSRIFWIHLLSAGVLCHTCSSSRGRHRTNPFVFVPDEKLSLLSELLMGEISRREQYQPELTRLLLTSLLIKISYALSREKTMLVSSEGQIESAAALSAGSGTNSFHSQAASGNYSTVVGKAIGFIEANLNEPALNPAAIAQHSCLSPSHLNRLFQTELHSSVMEYVTDLRLKKACTLLIETDLPIAEVADLSGYANASHFSQLLSRHKGHSPRAFREHYKKRHHKGPTPMTLR